MMKGTVIYMVLILVAGPTVFSQSERLDSLLSDVLGHGKRLDRLLTPPSTFVYAGLTSESKTFYAGRELGDQMFSVTGSAFLFHTGGLYFGATGSWYSQFEPRYSSTVVTAGFRKTLDRKKHLMIRFSGSRFLFNLPDTLTEAVNKNLAGAGITFRNEWIGARVSFNALYGSELTMNLVPALFANITITRLATSGKIFLAPEISAFIGPETVFSDPSGVMPDPLTITGTGTEAYTLLNAQLSLPVGIYLGDFDFEIRYSLNFPSSGYPDIKYPVSSFISLSAGYLLSL